MAGEKVAWDDLQVLEGRITAYDQAIDSLSTQVKNSSIEESLQQDLPLDEVLTPGPKEVYRRKQYRSAMSHLREHKKDRALGKYKLSHPDIILKRKYTDILGMQLADTDLSYLQSARSTISMMRAFDKYLGTRHAQLDNAPGSIVALQLRLAALQRERRFVQFTLSNGLDVRRVVRRRVQPAQQNGEDLAIGVLPAPEGEQQQQK